MIDFELDSKCVIDKFNSKKKFIFDLGDILSYITQNYFSFIFKSIILTLL
jgi:hypothetical protein